MKTFKILELKRRNNSTVGNPSWAIRAIDENGDYYYGKTASNALIAEDGERFNKTFCNLQGLLNNIRVAVDNKAWTSNADAFLCEMVGDFNLAELVRKNRAEYIEKQEENDRRKYAEECARQAEREKENARKQAEREQKAASDFANNEAIESDMFLSLCKHNNIILPIKTIGYIKDNVRYVLVRIENGEPRYVYSVNDKKRKSQSLFGYIENLYTVIKQKQ